MTMPAQLEILEDLVGDALRKGARVLTGGRRRSDIAGQYFEPTVLVDVDHSMRITQREQFGPIMVVIKVRSDEEAVQLANDCRYGLGSSVFSRDRQRAERIASRIRAGLSVVNDYGLAYMIQSLPFGGVGLSGVGRINGREGLRACCNTKAMVSDRFALPGGVSVYPIRPATFDVVRGAIGVIYGGKLATRARAAAGLVKSLVDLRK
jgi:acyl-CoA reductase-like NAD-dependent aldehyde dehydrogenase